MSALPVYLASRSPRRRELLAQIGIAHEILAFRAPPREDHEIDESPLAGESARDYVQRVASAKAQHGGRIACWRGLPPRPVLAADTTLELDGQIIGKPRNAEDACAILQLLSGRTHRVLTAVVVTSGARNEAVLSVNEVRFGRLDTTSIRRYVASGEPMDKAGAYAIQGFAACFVAHLSGSHSAVMGLPLYETARILERFGVHAGGGMP